MVWRRLLGFMVLATIACEPKVPTKPLPRPSDRKDISLVVAQHPDPEVALGAHLQCEAIDYAGVPDGRGGYRLDSPFATPEEALGGFLALPISAAAPRAGYHRLNGNAGSTTFLFVSGGRVLVEMSIAGSDRHYAVGHICGNAQPGDEPDLAWVPPAPPAPIGSTAQDRQLQAENRSLLERLPVLPGARLIAATLEADDRDRVAGTTRFVYALPEGVSRCTASGFYEQRLPAAGYEGGASETSEIVGTGSIRSSSFRKGEMQIFVGIRASEPGMTLLVTSRSSRPRNSAGIWPPCTVDRSPSQ